MKRLDPVRKMIAMLVAGLLPLVCSSAHARFGGFVFFPIPLPFASAPAAPRCPLISPDPDAPKAASPLASAGDANLAISLDAIIVPDGPGSWVRGAFFDEYRFRVSGKGQLLRVRLIDALGNPVESSVDATELIQESCRVEERYRASGIQMPRGQSRCSRLPRWLPRPQPQRTCETELKGLQSPLPATLEATTGEVTAFFPVVPWPSRIEITYSDGGNWHGIVVADPVLGYVHRLVKYRPEPALPAEAIRRGFQTGHVAADLSIDADGKVVGVRVTSASSPVFVEAARDTFFSYTYMPAEEARTVEEVMRFGRQSAQ